MPLLATGQELAGSLRRPRRDEIVALSHLRVWPLRTPASLRSEASSPPGGKVRLGAWSQRRKRVYDPIIHQDALAQREWASKRVQLSNASCHLPPPFALRRRSARSTNTVAPNGSMFWLRRKVSTEILSTYQSPSSPFQQRKQGSRPA
jgi:hypothetical protein